MNSLAREYNEKIRPSSLEREADLRIEKVIGLFHQRDQIKDKTSHQYREIEDKLTKLVFTTNSFLIKCGYGTQNDN